LLARLACLRKQFEHEAAIDASSPERAKSKAGKRAEKKGAEWNSGVGIGLEQQ
jgi:hypothetical protein